MPATEDVSRMEKALADISARFTAWDTRCAARGERVATLEEHARAMNGYLRRIEKSTARVEDGLEALGKSVAFAKGAWLIASMLLGAAIAWGVQFLPG